MTKGLRGMVGFLRERRAGRERDRQVRGVRRGHDRQVRGVRRGRLLTLLLALAATQLGSLAVPAHACGCGALVPGGGQRVAVHREASIVRWDGEQEQIVMRLSVGGDADRAAWIMPVPNRATVKLGDAEVFSQLTDAMAPEERTRYHFWPRDGDWPLTTDDGAGAAPPPPGEGAGVGVVGRERLGPFDVARLTATDPAALDDWLGDNGFTFPPRLETALQPYVDRGWEYVAVRLAPETAGTPLRGDLEPLHLTFAGDTLVYPMRLSRLATTAQSLSLYVLADHRMEPVSRIGGERPRVTFAGRVDTATGPLGELAEGTPFLTALAQEFPVPSSISGDHEFRRTAKDATFRQVVYRNRLLTVAGIPVWLLTVTGGLAALVTGAAVRGVRRRRARRQYAWGQPVGGVQRVGGERRVDGVRRVGGERLGGQRLAGQPSGTSPVPGTPPAPPGPNRNTSHISQAPQSPRVPPVPPRPPGSTAPPPPPGPNG
ncbi:DUF2330 domain-containing protein [Streptomyces sp. NPDC052015]|uniref:DUF2330 domain-containing protein n=1 Tax=Streptomyces sp. NPDC052015 TaxID=3154755 RepID=UPI003421EDEF